jgi:hypothetical protein
MNSPASPEEQEPGTDSGGTQSAASMDTRPKVFLTTNHAIREIPDREESSPSDSPLEIVQPILPTFDASETVARPVIPAICQDVTSKDTLSTPFVESASHAMDSKTIEMQSGVSDHAKTRSNAPREIPDTDSEDEDVMMLDIPIAQPTHVKNKMNESVIRAEVLEKQRVDDPQNKTAEHHKSTGNIIQSPKNSTPSWFTHDVLHEVLELDVDKTVTDSSVSVKDAPTVQAVHIQQDCAGESSIQSTPEARLLSLGTSTPSSIITDSFPAPEPMPLTPEQKRIVSFAAQELPTSYNCTNQEPTERSLGPSEDSNISSQ